MVYIRMERPLNSNMFESEPWQACREKKCVDWCGRGAVLGTCGAPCLTRFRNNEQSCMTSRILLTLSLRQFETMSMLIFGDGTVH